MERGWGGKGDNVLLINFLVLGRGLVDDSLRQNDLDSRCHHEVVRSIRGPRMGMSYIRFAFEAVGGQVVSEILLVEAGLLLAYADGGWPEAGAVRCPAIQEEPR